MTNAPSPTRKYHRWTIGDRLAVARKTITTNQAEAKMVRSSTSMLPTGRRTASDLPVGMAKHHIRGHEFTDQSPPDRP